MNNDRAPFSTLNFAPQNLKRVKGIEPSQPAWEAGALPLSNTRILLFYEKII